MGYFEKIKKLLSKLILTTAVGKESIDDFERSFNPEKLEDKLKSFSFSIDRKYYFWRKEEFSQPLKLTRSKI